MQHPSPSSGRPECREPALDPSADTWNPSGSASPRRMTSESLLAGAKEVEIEHQGSIYRLKITSLGKLILTK